MSNSPGFAEFYLSLANAILFSKPSEGENTEDR